MPATPGSRARISLMRRASVSQLSRVMLLLPTRMTSSTSRRATFFRAGMASATSPACRRPDGVLAMVPPVATTFTSGSRSCARTGPAMSKARAIWSGFFTVVSPQLVFGCSQQESRLAAAFESVQRRRRRALLPRAVVDDALVGGAGHHHVPLDRPVVGIGPALAGIGLRRGMEQAPVLEILRFQQAAGLADEVVDVGRGILLEVLHGARLRPEHLRERLAVEVVACRL